MTPPKQNKPRLSRRAFLKGSGLLVAATGAGSVLSSCSPEAGPAPTATPQITLDDKYLHVPPAPRVPPDPNRLYFLTEDEARTLSAMVGRILPGTPDDPGAVDGGAVTFIDYMLANHEGYAEPAYTQPPFARFYEGDEPPPEAAGTDPNEVIWVPARWRAHFGWQAGAAPRDLYRAGLAALNQMAGGSFAGLSEAQQDALLEQISGEGDRGDGGQGGTGGDAFDQLGIPAFSAKTFFDMVKQHVVHAMFGDPLYGGNRFLSGWVLVGYPGARRAYTARDMQTEGTPLEPQSLANLPPFHPGQPVSDDVVIPLANGTLIEQQAEQAHNAQLLRYCQLKK